MYQWLIEFGNHIWNATGLIVAFMWFWGRFAIGRKLSPKEILDEEEACGTKRFLHRTIPYYRD